MAKQCTHTKMAEANLATASWKPDLGRVLKNLAQVASTCQHPGCACSTLAAYANPQACALAQPACWHVPAALWLCLHHPGCARSILTAHVSLLAAPAAPGLCLQHAGCAFSTLAAHASTPAVPAAACLHMQALWLYQQHSGCASGTPAVPAARWLCLQHAGCACSTLAVPLALCLHIPAVTVIVTCDLEDHHDCYTSILPAQQHFGCACSTPAAPAQLWPWWLQHAGHDVCEETFVMDWRHWKGQQ
ncbi:hypothetical protein DUNSADRAFT_8618 [Dunaliella salina]|uniref:Uncharacterized protein n=1 Tax=Dunaliella salina TaxID=3046 RepID=A0ABQ7H5U2_DUNSA|nr:hypothetical protein DUNSADRAFT_8618 [Dunaliella salina]|eukprot:KAF5842218.1 hypothetical protein DUNSADRAFT_8618 [Dunaliella salina]